MKLKNRLCTIITLILALQACEEENTRVIIDELPFAYHDCINPLSENTFDIITWNVKEFPVAGEESIQIIAKIVKAQNADLVALQEITNPADFEYLVSALDGWEGHIYESGGLRLGFIFKKSEVNFIGEPKGLFEDDEFAFPRPPFYITAEHLNGLRVHLINVHLKCCNGEENELRRLAGSEKLKEFTDSTLPDSPVIILGDFNDLIIESDPSRNVFTNFITDSLHYTFADLSIAEGPSSSWSYPSWPSHIDHIIVTDELFSHVSNVLTLSYDTCDAAFFEYVSDHRPLLLSLINNK